MFEKYINIKFHENPFGGSRVVPRGRSDRHKNMTKLTATFSNFKNPPKNDNPHTKFDIT